MKPATGRWVTGDDFFGREVELAQLESLVRAGNPVLLTGQRRIGKTSIARELGRRMGAAGWTFLLADVQGTTSPEEFVTEVAKAVYPLRPRWSRIEWPDRWLGRGVEEFNILKFGIKFRAQVTPGNWRRRGEMLFAKCAKHQQPVLFVVDELPIFLKHMLDEGNGPGVKHFLSWFRKVVQDLEAAVNPPAFIVSGSVGLEWLARRIGASDRINHLHPYRLRAWNRDECVACFRRLADSVGLKTEEGVADAVYDKLGLGIPHHVQSFLVRLHDYDVRTQHSGKITTDDVDLVYHTYLLGPSGQNDLAHYEDRLKDAMGRDGYTLAMEILAEASVQGAFTSQAESSLEQRYESTIDDVAKRITETIDILVYDGYIRDDSRAEGIGPYVFSSNLLKDWWRTRFLNHYRPLDSGRRGPDAKRIHQ